MKITRNTQARKAILAMVNDSNVALSQPAIQTALNGLCDRVTIYRVLDRLVEEGLVHKIVNVNGVVNYAACSTCSHETEPTDKHQHAHQHVHFSCRVCNELTCLEQVIPHFDLPPNFHLEETFFTISGTCSNCTVKIAQDA
jgi:Fur family ferric uptake transcriptional regulator